MELRKDTAFQWFCFYPGIHDTSLPRKGDDGAIDDFGRGMGLSGSVDKYRTSIFRSQLIWDYRFALEAGLGAS